MKKMALLVLIFGIVLGTPALAENTSVTTTSNTEVKAQVDSINSLTEQIRKLQAERSAKMSTLITQLRQGSKGDAVTTLQTLLSLDSSIYPEGLVTGYFGPLTAKAVRKFQEKNGLAQVGNVGPRTVEKLKKLAEDRGLTVEDDDGDDEDNSNRGNGKKICAIIPPGQLIAPGLIKKEGWEKRQIPDCQNLPKGIKDKLENEDSDDEDSEDSDKSAPRIMDIQVKKLSDTSVKISWATNESAKGKIWYSKTTPVILDTATTQEASTLLKTQSVTLTSLSSSTKYYFVISATDASGNTSKSSRKTFETGTPTDTTGPVISNLTTSDLTATSAKLAWNTNEAAKDKVWFGTTNPVVITGTPTTENTSLRSSHSFNLSGLTANTIYFYIVTSTDEAGNATTSAQGTFTTSL